MNIHFFNILNPSILTNIWHIILPFFLLPCRLVLLLKINYPPILCPPMLPSSKANAWHHICYVMSCMLHKRDTSMTYTTTTTMAHLVPLPKNIFITRCLSQLFIYRYKCIITTIVKIISAKYKSNTIAKSTSTNFQMDISSITKAKGSSSTQPRTLKVFSSTLAPIGGGLLVPPNTIDFKAVFSNFGERFLDSPVVFSVILGIILIYIPVMVWARRVDHKDNLKVCVTI